MGNKSLKQKISTGNNIFETTLKKVDSVSTEETTWEISKEIETKKPGLLFNDYEFATEKVPKKTIHERKKYRCVITDVMKNE